MNAEEVKPKKRTRVKPGAVRKPVTRLIHSREAVYLPVGFCYLDDNGSYHFSGGYVLCRDDYKEYNEFIFPPKAEDLLEGRFVSQEIGECIVSDAESMYLEVDTNDFLEVVKKHLETD